MDLTPPGAPAEGHIYLNDPTGEIITYYKGSKSSVSKKPGGETQEFFSPEALINYLASKPSLQKSSNSLSETEMGIIEDLAQQYGLIAKVDYIGPKAKGIPYMVILDKAGQRRFTTRKLSNKFFFYKIVYKPNVIKGEPESVLHAGDWNALVKEMHIQFATLAQPTVTTPDKDKNKLSVSEMQAVDKLAKKFTLKTQQSVLPPNAQFVPYLTIQSSMGSNIWAVRKFESMYEILNIISDQNWEKLEIEPTFSEMLLKLNKLFEKYMSEPTKGLFEFSPQETNNINQIAAQFHLLTKGIMMKLEPDKHQVSAIELLDPQGKTVWHLHKDNGTYRIYKVFADNNTWDLFYDTTNPDAFFQQLTLYLHGHSPAGTPIGEHKGITPEEYQQIKETVDSYGEGFWTEYVKGSLGHFGRVEIYIKNYEGKGSIYFGVGAVGSYYQLLDSQNNPTENIPTLNGVIARIHDRLSEQGGQAVLDPHDLDEIVNLAQKYGFDYDAPEGDEPYTFVDDDNIIEVNPHGSVKYTFKGIFGPIYVKNAKTFINWFKNIYGMGKVPATGEDFADHIYAVLDSGGFIDHNNGQVIPHQKVNAIKAARFYIMGVTGGPCGLGKTKWAIENLKMFLDYVKKHGLPNMDSNAPDFLTQFSEPPHEVSVPNKLLEEEIKEIINMVGSHSPAMKYQLSKGGIIIWIGTLTSYKVTKENDIYQVLADVDGEWSHQAQYTTFKELREYLEDMLNHIAKALANSKLGTPNIVSSSADPEKLSAEEVAELKKLIKKFKLPMATSYSKKLMEAAFPQEAYNVVISDPEHNTFVKIYKDKGMYVFSKGIGDAYYVLKRFDKFDNLLAYTDYFLNSYIKEPESEPVKVEKMSDEEVKMLKDLVKKHIPKGAKVRRKYMTAKSTGKVPYVFIEMDDKDMTDFAIAKAPNGTYKLFEVDTLFEEWKQVAATDSWEGMYDILNNVLSGEPLPGDKEKYNPSVLDADQFDWLETMMKTHKPQVLIKKWGNGVIGGYDSTNKIKGEFNPLFVIRFAPGSTEKRILQVQTEDGGMAADEYPFNTFEAMAHFIVKNLEVVTQLLKTEHAVESNLASVITKAGFEYTDSKDVALDTGESKHATIYENDKHERLYLFDDGSSRIWHKNPADGETYKKEFANVAGLVMWMEDHYSGEPPAAYLKEIKEYLAYLDFKIEGHKSDKFSTVWVKTLGAEHQPGYDYVHLHADGTSKVNPSPLIGEGSPHSSSFFFNTVAGLKQYLSEKYIKGKNYANAYLKQVIKLGKFHKVQDQLSEMGFKWENNKMIVVPFPDGGIMQTATGVDPKVVFSFESTYDLAKRLDLFLEGDADYVDPGWATGYDELDTLIDKAGFVYQGHEKVHDGQKLVFWDAGGTKLFYYTQDENSTIEFPPSAAGKQGIGFTNVEDLIDYLKKYEAHPKTEPTPANKFPEDSEAWQELEAKLVMAGFMPSPPDKSKPHVKKFTNQKGDVATIWNNTGAIKQKGTEEVYFDSWEGLADHIDWVYGKAGEVKPSSTNVPENESVLQYSSEVQNLIGMELVKIFSTPTVESIHFQHNSKGMGAGEIRAIAKNILQFAIGKKFVGADLLWYVRQKVADNPSGLYMTYFFKTKEGMVQWIKDNADSLASFKTIKGTDGLSLGSPSVPPPKITGPHSDLGKAYHQSLVMEALLHKAGFHLEMNSLGILWEHKSDLQLQIFEQGFVWRTEKSTKEVSIAYPYHGDIIQKICLKVTPDMSAEEVDNIISEAFKDREEKLFDKACEMAANAQGEDMSNSEINKALQNRGFYWLQERMWTNDDLLQVVVANPKDAAQSLFKFWWIRDKKIHVGSALTEQELLQWVGPDGKLEKQKKSASELETGSVFLPSGETYKTHENEGNADMIWLNDHDGALLKMLGFVPVPSENHYYKNQNGNIVKFFDTGKAEYIDYFGFPNQPEKGEVINFETIPHTLKFMVAKHSTYPFSSQNYKDDDGEHVYEIQLNPHDDFIMEQLGFQWDEKAKKYIKLLGPDDKPNIQEAKKKKKKLGQKTFPLPDPNQPELPLGDPNSENPVDVPDPGEMPPEDAGQYDPPDPEVSDDDGYSQHEEFTAYDTGKGIWQLMNDASMDEEVEMKEGMISAMLFFIWNRWHHQLASNLSNKPSQGKPAAEVKPAIPQAFLNIQGIEAPPSIHEKLEHRGFNYDASLKGYYKKYQEPEPGLLWTLIKWDGNTYHVSYPHKEDNGVMIHKEFTMHEPYHVMNTLLKIENAEFGDLVQSEDDALKKGDANYFNAPNGWLPYNPYSPKVHPGNIKPEDWIDKELGAYGFEWSNDGKMYWWKDTDGKVGTHWQAIRFDKNGTIVYFYHTATGNPRYFCSKDFSQVQLRIEKNFLTGASTGVPKKVYPLDPKNYPTAPDWAKNFSQAGTAIQLNDTDHLALLQSGFKFLVNTKTYLNPKTKDQFRIFSNGFAWYKLTGVGEGISNDLGHFFDMLKSKYGQLEWGFHPLTGHEAIQIKDKFEKIGFEEKPNMASPEDMYFYRVPTDGKTSVNVKEMVVVFPNHSMTFYLYDITSTDRMLGSFEFDSLTYGIHVLQDLGAGSIALHLADDLSTELHNQGFLYVPQKLRYEHVMGNGGLKITLAFYGNGQVWAHLLQPDPSTSDGTEVVKDKMFMSFYDAILWAAHKNFEASDPAAHAGPPIKGKILPSLKNVKEFMKDLGYEHQGPGVGGEVFKSTSGYRVFRYELATGRVIFNFQYIVDQNTGEMGWGQTMFKTWTDFVDFVQGKTHPKPTSGKLTYTPHPSATSLPSLLTPMPFSGFDYEGWAKGQGHNPKATIKLVPEDDQTMQKIGWGALQTENDVYYYTNKNGDIAYFYVDGHAQLLPKGKTPITLPKVKMAMAMMWAEYYEDKNAGLPPTPEISQEKNDVMAELFHLGFNLVGGSGQVGGGEFVFEKKNKILNASIIWDIDKKTLEYQLFHHGKIKEHWTKPVDEGMKELANKFAGSKKSSVTPPTLDVAKELEELGFHTILSSGPPDNPSIMFEKKDAKLRHLVLWDKKNNKLDYTSKKIDDPSVVTASWEEDVNVGLALLGHIFTPKEKKEKHPTEVGQMKLLGFKRLNETDYDFVKYEGKWMYHVNLGFPTNTMHFVKSENKIKKSHTKIVEQWNKAMQDGFEILVKLFGSTSKKKKVLAGTEDMPWSGTNYKILWIGQPANTGLMLNQMEEETMKKMGWHRGQDNSGPGHAYFKGNEKMRFYKNEKVEYWSNYGTGPTQSWDTVEMPIRWLWKNKPVPKPTQEQVEAVLTHLGFEKIPVSTITTSGESKKGWGWRLIDSDGVNDITFDIEANTLRWALLPYNSQLQSGTTNFDTIQKGLNALIAVFKGQMSKPKLKATGDVPYSGKDYQDWWATYWPDVPPNYSISLLPEDDETLAKIGFVKKVIPDDTHPESKYMYENTGGTDRAFFFASGKGAYWKTPGDGPYYHNTVKDLMQFLWDKYAPFI